MYGKPKLVKGLIADMHVKNWATKIQKLIYGIPKVAIQWRYTIRTKSDEKKH